MLRGERQDARSGLTERPIAGDGEEIVKPLTASVFCVDEAAGLDAVDVTQRDGAPC